MDVLEIGTEQDFKNHNDLPLARIKRIMKSDEDVRMISAEAPVLFAKACEMFILEITLRYALLKLVSPYINATPC
jgi:nuclear transcription factor Y, gamma